jgi:hypothetical protein
MRRLVPLLVLVWLIVGAVAAGLRGYFHPRHRELRRRRHDRGARDRRTAELRGCQSQSHQLPAATT